MEKGIGLPPRLAPPLLLPGRRRRPPLSPFRRALRMMVWATFAVVLSWRFLHPPEPVDLAQFMPGRRAEFERGQRGRRAPTRLYPSPARVPGDLWRLEIEIERKDVQVLRGYFWNGWRGAEPGERPEVLATVREGGVVYTNVALHLKGSAGSFRPFDDKPALTLNFSKHASGQRFHGFSKVSLNNSVQDASYLSEAICREMFLEAGVPTPRADHATVLVNGRDLGLYVLTEGWSKTFLRRHFEDVRGNLYDGGFLKDITSRLDANSGENPEDRSDLDRLAEAAAIEDPTDRWRRLGEVLDMDRFLTFLALEVMTCHWDGYGQNRNNYRVFHDRSTDRLVFMPHGMDQMFGVFRSSPESSIHVGMQGLVARAVVTTPDGRRAFVDRIARLHTGLFQEHRWTNRVGELARRIRPTLLAYSPQAAREHDWHVADLRRRISDRCRSLAEQLASPQQPLEFGPDGAVPLTGWKPRPVAQDGAATTYERADHDGVSALRIAVRGAQGVSSWRTRVLLEAGRYRFEAASRTEGVEPGGGACVRISGFRSGGCAGAAGDWTPLSFSFATGEMLNEVELICELRATQGEAWFDEASLRLVRE